MDVSKCSTARLAAVFVGLGAAVLTLAGCTASGSGPRATGPGPTTAGPTTSSVAAASPATTATASRTSPSPATSSTPATTATVSGATRCSTATLKGSLKTDGAAAGTTYLHLLLENSGDTACTLQGWPGTSLVTTTGRQIGQAAYFDRSSSHDTVTLQPRTDAIARIGIGTALDYPKSKCNPTPAHQVRIYPPGSKASLLVPLGYTAIGCSSSAVHLLVVTALHSGS